MRIALLIEYFGKQFCGSQLQKAERTVQSVLEEGIGVWLRQPIRVIFSGRTDSGVHALGQVAHFDLPDRHDFNADEFCWRLNGILPDDLSIRAATEIDSGFHARFTAVRRTYIYRILNHKQRSPLRKDTHYFVRQPMAIKNMQQSIACLVGSHDFAAFKSSSPDRLTTVCNVSKTQLLHLGEGELEFSITANHFVYNMVRIIVGTMIEIGLNKKAMPSLEQALEKRDRQYAGPTAPARGLSLASVSYPPPYENIFADKAIREMDRENIQCKV